MTDKKRILLLTRPICPPWDEASKNFAYTLAKNIKDFEMHLLTCGHLADLAPSSAKASAGKDNADNVVQHPIYSSPKLDLAQKLRLFKFLKEADNFDVIHSLFTPTKINSFFIKRALRNKKIKFIQTVATLREDLYSANNFKKILFGDLVITYSDYAKEKLEQMGFQNIKRIYPGIDIEKYSPAPKKIILMDKYGIKNGDFVINFTGEYARLGAIDDVVDSFIDLAKENKNFHLQLACRIKNKKDREKKEEIIERLETSVCLDKVRFLDDQSYEMQDIYNLSDVSVFPVRDMAGKFDIPLAVIEAMACAKPVIASNLERLKHFLNNDNSILIEPGDREALKEKIIYLYENRNTRDKLGKKGMEFARENFNIMKIVKEYEEIYNKL